MAATVTRTDAGGNEITGEDSAADDEDAVAPGDNTGTESDPAVATGPVVSKTDVDQTGNRIAEGQGSLTGAPLTVALPSTPRWVLGWPATDMPGWLVVFEDGTAALVTDNGEILDGPPLPADVAAGAPPELAEIASDSDSDGSGDQQFAVRSAYAEHHRFSDPLPDTRVVTDGTFTAALATATNRYPHAVLGDSLEAAAVEIIDERTGELTRIEIADPAVIEGVSPMLADIDQDGTNEVLVTISDASVGARLAAYRVDGTLLATTEPIGLGRRWRNQLAVAPVGPDGELEIIDVRTPHIGGTVEYFRLDGANLTLAAASEATFTSHSIGSRNLDLGIVADGDGDGRLDVLVPTSDRTGIAVLTRTDDTVTVNVVPLEGRVVTNLAPRSGDGRLAIAVATSDALQIWTG